MTAGISWNYTTWLNIASLILAAVLVVRFVRTGGIPMLRMMGGSPDTGHDHHGHGHGHGHDHDHDHGHGHGHGDGAATESARRNPAEAAEE